VNRIGACVTAGRATRVVARVGLGRVLRAGYPQHIAVLDVLSRYRNRRDVVDDIISLVDNDRRAVNRLAIVREALSKVSCRCLFRSEQARMRTETTGGRTSWQHACKRMPQMRMSSHRIQFSIRRAITVGSVTLSGFGPGGYRAFRACSFVNFQAKND
jgi:hypothetical protein